MRTALAFVVTTTVAALLVTADRAFAQPPGQLRVTVQLSDSRSGITCPAVKKALTITAEAGGPVSILSCRLDSTSSSPPARSRFRGGDDCWCRRRPRWQRRDRAEAWARVMVSERGRSLQSMQSSRLQSAA